MPRNSARRAGFGGSLRVGTSPDLPRMLTGRLRVDDKVGLFTDGDRIFGFAFSWLVLCLDPRAFDSRTLLYCNRLGDLAIRG